MDILPCPFCGSKAQVENNQYPISYGYYDAAAWVECTQCKLQLPRVYLRHEQDVFEVLNEKAIERWNQRYGNN